MQSVRMQQQQYREEANKQTNRFIRFIMAAFTVHDKEMNFKCSFFLSYIRSLKCTFIDAKIAYNMQLHLGHILGLQCIVRLGVCKHSFRNKFKIENFYPILERF